MLNPDNIQKLNCALLAKYGWFAHVVHDDIHSPTEFNYHTHGFDSIGGTDIQIVYPLDPKTLHNIAGTIFTKMKEGTKFKHGDRVSGIIKNFDVMFIDSIESDRPVLRVILPDKHGKLEPEDLSTDDVYFLLQWS